MTQPQLSIACQVSQNDCLSKRSPDTEKSLTKTVAAFIALYMAPDTSLVAVAQPETTLEETTPDTDSAVTKTVVHPSPTGHHS
ncbi:MAG: hypothetical protein O3B13_20690 [Planctomycetota bacterium]|nr:hypothetical protein [Planctomycetota bacterium]